MAASDIPGRAAYLWIYREWIASGPPRGAAVVEVGLGLGRSVAALCEMLDEAGRSDIVVYGVDPFAGNARNGEQQVMADAAGGDFALYAGMMMRHAPRAFERVRVIRLTGYHFGNLLEHEVGVDERHVGCVVLDGDHDYDEVAAEIDIWSDVLRQQGGGVIGGDDYHAEQFPGVVQAVNERWAHDEIDVRLDCDWPTWRVRI